MSNPATPSGSSSTGKPTSSKSDPFSRVPAERNSLATSTGTVVGSSPSLPLVPARKNQLRKTIANEIPNRNSFLVISRHLYHSFRFAACGKNHDTFVTDVEQLQPKVSIEVVIIRIADLFVLL